MASYISSVVTLFSLLTLVASQSKIHEKLRLAIEANPAQTHDIIVSFATDTDATIKRATQAYRAKRSLNKTGHHKRTHIVSALKHFQEQSQAAALNILSSAKARSSKSRGFKYTKQFWLGNQMFVKAAESRIIRKLALEKNVTLIQVSVPAQFPKEIRDFEEVSISSGTNARTTQTFPADWHLNALKVKEAWKELGHKGKDVVVGIIDSGVDVTHDKLKDNFRGSAYGWRDVHDEEFNITKFTTDPVDNYAATQSANSHGTSCAGCAVGKDVGVAPDAKWIACSGCYYFPEHDYQVCAEDWILQCLDFMACPTLHDYTKPDCSKAPNILTFSIVGPMNENSVYDESFKSLKAMKIIAVASIGNTGPHCFTTSAPASRTFVIGVGAVKSTAPDKNPGSCEYAGISAIGPGNNGDIKPDVVAPGQDLILPVAGPNSQMSDLPHIKENAGSVRKYKMGTSFATPMVAGVVALLYSQNPKLTFEKALYYLTSTAEKVPVKNHCCPYFDYNAFPNNYVGYGLVNALKAVQAQKVEMASQGK